MVMHVEVIGAITLLSTGVCLLVGEILAMLFRSFLATVLVSGGLMLFLFGLFSLQGSSGMPIGFLLLLAAVVIALFSHVRWAIQLCQCRQSG